MAVVIVTGAFGALLGRANLVEPATTSRAYVSALQATDRHDIGPLFDFARCGATLATIGAAMLPGWILARWEVLPAGKAVWGCMLGAATAMLCLHPMLKGETIRLDGAIRMAPR